MSGPQRIWLVLNKSSGGNDDAARAALRRACNGGGFAIDRVISFPLETMPTGARLDAAGIATVAVFAGDGTANALIAALAGWSGAVLVLPGGTMNLLYRRLHGRRGLDEVVRLAATGKARPVRPRVLVSRRGTALADLLAGPGTSWYEVREAIREADLVAAAAGMARAFGQTLATPGIACREPALGRAEGYPLVMLTPTDEGIHVRAFHARTPGEFLSESWAVLRRRFREGPHDDLGLVEEVTLASTADEPFAILIDGERARCPAAEHFGLAPCAVDLLATEADGG